jgi:hypothetical protein
LPDDVLKQLALADARPAHRPKVICSLFGRHPLAPAPDDVSKINRVSSRFQASSPSWPPRQLSGVRETLP